MSALSRTVVVAALLALGVAGCGSDGPAESRAASAADREAVSTTPGASAAASSSASATPTPTASPTPSATPTPSPTATAAVTRDTPDGATYALLRSTDGVTLTYDKVDYKKASCDAIARRQPVPQAEGFAACFSNVNPKLRTVALAPTVLLEEIVEGDVPARLPIAQLPAFINRSDGTTAKAYRVVKLTVSSSRVTRIEQIGVSSA